ncbi:MAG: fibronectin type III domain-containing protein [Elusimicrobia bacterium]|nr:fibronectin type III domain-containing protein [Elusimicrobiota bacterium]
MTQSAIKKTFFIGSIALAAPIGFSFSSEFHLGLPAAVKKKGVQLSEEVGPRWQANLSVSQASGVVAAGTPIESSSRLRLAWSAPSEEVDHYEFSIMDMIAGQSVSTQAFKTDTSLLLENLKSGTSYKVTAVACKDSACAQTWRGSNQATGTTKEEYWLVKSTANSLSSVTKIVSNGNTVPSALRYGNDAGAGIEGYLQLYYNPAESSQKGMKIATTTNSAATYSSFTALGASYGLNMPSTTTYLLSQIGTFAAVPLSASMGSKIRFFFEATQTTTTSNGEKSLTRIVYVDSQDGYRGWDFNSGTSTLCQTADYAVGGGCEPAIVIGNTSDTVNGNYNIKNARQFKVGYPALTDWLWDGAAGTFMIFTLETVTSCSDYQMLFGYAVWSGTNWIVQYASESCPKFFEAMQAAMPVHIGGAKYKMYFSYNASAAVISSSSKPVKMIYADGAVTGLAGRIDFEDWESEWDARGVHYLWANGVELTDAEEGQLDDFVIFAPDPDADPKALLMYTNIRATTTDDSMPFLAMATLINP